MRVRIILRSTTLLCVAAASAFAQVRQPPRTPTRKWTPPTPLPALTTLTLSHDSISGGGPGIGVPNGSVTLSGAAPTGGLVVTLTSDNAAATVPQSVTVIAGQTQQQFSIATAPVTAPIFARITARAGSATLTDSLKLLLRVVSVVEAGWVPGSNETQRLFRVTMNGPAPPGGLTVPARFSFVASGACHPAPTFSPAVVPAGVTTADITLTADMQMLKQYEWEVTYGGVTMRPPQLTVMAARVGPITIPTTIAGGTTSYGTVQMLGGSTPPASCLAQFRTWYIHEYTLYLSSSNTALLQVPSSALVSPGQNQLSFAITASSVTTQQTATITVSRPTAKGSMAAIKQVTITLTP